MSEQRVAQLQAQIDEIAREAAKAASETLRLGKASEAQDRLLRAASALAEANRRIFELRQQIEVIRDKPVGLAKSTQQTIKHLREMCGRTQQGLADDMVRLGFTSWKRMTVVEVENGRRKPSWEELIGLAVLFQVSVPHLLVGGLTHLQETSSMRLQPVKLNERLSAFGDDVRTMLQGDSHSRGSVRTASKSIASIGTGDEDWRPIAAAKPRGLQALVVPTSGDDS